VASAEEAMASLVTTHLSGAKQTADLFAGIGTFALRLARKSAVRAFETDAPALAAIEKAKRTASGLKPLSVERRDLFRRPVTAKELGSFDALAFDPPRAGAEAQSRELAISKVGRIAAVSCNPATLARDCRILVDGGYKLLSVTPIDQFLWSHHVEAVALLER
jgi:23S rRNA (uracil1939-C5)-methyltransferase